VDAEKVFESWRRRSAPARCRGRFLAARTLERSRLSGVVACAADFSDAIMKGLQAGARQLEAGDPDRADLSGADLSGADLTGADLRDCI